jgi:putative ABC transport system substrate-binding protein
VATIIARRKLLAALAGATTWSLASRAQQTAMPVVGFLYAGSSQAFAARLAAFRQGLKESGYVEGQNVAVEYRWVEDNYERLPALAAELVQQRVAVIAAVGTEAPALAAKNATSTIPIVFQTGGDPVTAGLVDSLNHPGGHITGVTRIVVEVVAKSLEVLHRVVPAAAEIAVLINPATPFAAEQSLEGIQDAARSLGLRKIQVLNASSEHEIDVAIGNAVQRRVGALLINTDSVFNSHIDQLAALTLGHALPALYSTREFAVAGGLISYGANLPDQYRQVGAYVGRILAGAKPADLPVLQPTKFELVINLKTARALGLDVPPQLLALADEVIE